MTDEEFEVFLTVLLDVDCSMLFGDERSRSVPVGKINHMLLRYRIIACLPRRVQIDFISGDGADEFSYRTRRMD